MPAIAKWTVTLSLLILTSCITLKKSPAPACVKYIGPPVIGGCFGKTAIVDLSVEPAIPCLDVTVNNCNGGILEIHNRCDAPLSFDELTIQSGESEGVDVARKRGGYSLVVSDGNFSRFETDENVNVRVSGLLGDRQVVIAFTRTGPLCD